MTPFTDTEGAQLLRLARHSIHAHITGIAPDPLPDLDYLKIPAASFVTLTQHKQLRGCIGSLQAWRTLGEDVSQNAIAAATRDPRFPSLLAAELPLTRIEVSLLSVAEPLSFRDEADLLAQLRPHTDGLILYHGQQQATFLPQVWHQIPEPADFLAHLKMKAGLAPDHQTASLRFARYSVQKWLEAPH
ncbi:AmmeMemoRadiSam system protein A [Chitinilyticum piscinae]|uniref:AmmeMemoRadiSam system protein A n=1 Tax=Chitinilyticum piscinae TaxID=2866724 RepID=A0A8J7FRM8_9NEIS|nr:AmmeMemoRadiSam system protein A [Chitinilyticum piscinae]MBE9609636.1 AmmeMemoRadiSam system protein A [Chitinilyticum piscinae]